MYWQDCPVYTTNKDQHTLPTHAIIIDVQVMRLLTLTPQLFDACMRSIHKCVCGRHLTFQASIPEGAPELVPPKVGTAPGGC